MSLFKRNNKSTDNHKDALADAILSAIHDGVIMTNQSGIIEFINQAAVNMHTACGSNTGAHIHPSLSDHYAGYLSPGSHQIRLIAYPA